MVRRNQQKRRNEARAKKEAEEQVAEAAGSCVPPPRDERQERSYTAELGSGGLLRLKVHFWRRGADTTEFVLILQTREWNQWKNGPRIDCCHGVCHVHKDDDEPMSDRLKTLNSVDDVKGAWAVADIAIRKIADNILGREEG